MVSLTKNLCPVKISISETPFTYSLNQVFSYLENNSLVDREEAIEHIKNFREYIARERIFSSGSAADSKDLFFYVIGHVHAEMNLLKENLKNQNKLFPVNYSLDRSNMALSFQDFFTRFYNCNDSCITNLFYGIEQTLYECTQCNTVTYNFHSMNFIEISVKELYEYNKNKKKKIIIYCPILNITEGEK